MAMRSNNALAAAAPSQSVMEFAISLVAVLAALLVVTSQGFALAALCIPLAALAFVRFDWFLCGVVFLLPWYPFIDWNLPVRDLFLLVHFALFGGFFFIQLHNGVPLKDWLWRGCLRKGIVCFAVIAVISLLLSASRDGEGAVKALAKLLSYTGVFLTVAGWAATRQRIARILQIILVSTIVVCLFGFYQAFVGDFTGLYFRMYPDMQPVYAAQGGWNGRITSFLFHYNSLAGYLSAIIPFALATAIWGNEHRSRWLAFVSLSLALAGLYLTVSRGGLLAGGVVLLAGMWFVVPRFRAVSAVLTALLLATAIVVSLPATKSSESPGERLQNVDEFTVQSRVALWDTAAVIFFEHPVIGAGFGTYRFAMQRYIPGIPDQLDAHNLYLQTLAETGAVGFLVFFVTMGAFLRSGLKLMKSSDALFRIMGFGVLGAIAATLVHGFVDYIFIASPQFGNLFWLLLALGLAAQELLQKQASTLVEVPGVQ